MLILKQEVCVFEREAVAAYSFASLGPEKILHMKTACKSQINDRAKREHHICHLCESVAQGGRWMRPAGGSGVCVGPVGGVALVGGQQRDGQVQRLSRWGPLGLPGTGGGARVRGCRRGRYTLQGVKLIQCCVHLNADRY